MERNTLQSEDGNLLAEYITFITQVKNTNSNTDTTQRSWCIRHSWQAWVQDRAKIEPKAAPTSRAAYEDRKTESPRPLMDEMASAVEKGQMIQRRIASPFATDRLHLELEFSHSHELNHLETVQPVPYTPKQTENQSGANDRSPSCPPHHKHSQVICKEHTFSPASNSLEVTSPDTLICEVCVEPKIQTGSTITDREKSESFGSEDSAKSLPDADDLGFEVPWSPEMRKAYSRSSSPGQQRVLQMFWKRYGKEFLRTEREDEILNSRVGPNPGHYSPH